MKKSKSLQEPIDFAFKRVELLTKSVRLCIAIPIILIFAVIGGLFLSQTFLYGDSIKWYSDPFTLAMVVFFAFGQLVAFKQFTTYYSDVKKIEQLIRTLATSVKIRSFDDLATTAHQLRKSIPDSDLKTLIINWLTYVNTNTEKRNESLENNSYIRLDLEREKSGYFHILMNRITLKLGFIGTLIGLLMTFPNMKRAILSLENSDGEMTFVTDIARAIDGDQYAILTTLLATGISLLGEFLTIQLLHRYSLEREIIMSHLTDWYHSSVEPYYPCEISDSEQSSKNQVRSLEDQVASQFALFTELAERSQKQLDTLVKFSEALTQRIDSLESSEAMYRSLLTSKLSLENELNKHVASLTTHVMTTEKEIEKISESQSKIGLRVQSLHEYETQYRSLIAIKESVTVPSALKPSTKDNQ